MRVSKFFLVGIALHTLLLSGVSWALITQAPEGLGKTASAKSLGFDPTRLKKLDRAMAKFVSEGQVAGMSTLLVRHGKIASFATYGQMKPDSIVRIYSMTKPITGVAMMILLEEGKWQLDDPITKYIPEFKELTVFDGVDSQGKMKTVPVARPPTMRELMAHTAGFGYGLSPGHPVDVSFIETAVLGSSSLEEMIAKIAKIPLKFQPGTEWNYSVAVDIQGYLVEKLSGMKLGEFMKKRIFDPLKMNDTAFQTGVQKASRLVPVFGTDPKSGKMVEATKMISGAPMPNYIDPPVLESGGGGLVSTIRDYGRFAQMILNGGELEGIRIISTKSVELMGTNAVPQSVLAADTSKTERLRKMINESLGFGLDFAVRLDPSKGNSKQGKGTVSWGGAAGTWFWIDPVNDLYFVGMIQKFGETPSVQLRELSAKLTYEALTHPKK